MNLTVKTTGLVPYEFHVPLTSFGGVQVLPFAAKWLNEADPVSAVQSTESVKGWPIVYSVSMKLESHVTVVAPFVLVLCTSDGAPSIGEVARTRINITNSVTLLALKIFLIA